MHQTLPTCHTRAWHLAECLFVCVQALDRDLEDAEEQYGTALRGHLQVVDSLQDMQYARMKTMQEQFQSNLKVCNWVWPPVPP